MRLTQSEAAMTAFFVTRPKAAIENSLNNRRTRIKNRWKQCFRLPFVASGTTMAIENFVSNDFGSTFADSVNVFDCRLSGVSLVNMQCVFFLSKNTQAGTQS